MSDTYPEFLLWKLGHNSLPELANQYNALQMKRYNIILPNYFNMNATHNVYYRLDDTGIRSVSTTI